MSWQTARILTWWFGGVGLVLGVLTVVLLAVAFRQLRTSKMRVYKEKQNG